MLVRVRVYERARVCARVRVCVRVLDLYTSVFKTTFHIQTDTKQIMEHKQWNVYKHIRTRTYILTSDIFRMCMCF